MISTIRAWIESILGEYEPITYLVKGSVAYNDGSGGAFHDFQYTKVADGLAGLDWSYIVTITAIRFRILTIYSPRIGSATVHPKAEKRNK